MLVPNPPHLQPAPTHLVLASASPARRALLRQAGIEPTVYVSDVDEAAVEAEARATYGDLEPAEARRRAGELMLELGVDTPGDRRPGQISGGQAQRIALCRALVHRPAVLLADEPTGNLDDASAAGVITALRRHARSGGITLVVTHDDRLVDACEQRIEL